MTPEEAQASGQANVLIENNLSSVKISRNTKGTTWEIKIKHEDPFRAAEVACEINAQFEYKYGNDPV